MYGVSDLYRQTLGMQHTVVSRCTVLRGDEPVSPVLSVIDADLTVDPDASIRRAGKITALDDGGQLTPDLVSRIVDVYSCELQLERGVRYPDGTEEVFPTGRMSMSGLTIGEEHGGVTFTANVLDRSARCQGTMSRPFAIAGGTLLEEAIPPLLSTRLATLTYRMHRTGYRLATQLLDHSKDAWAESLANAKSAGQQLFMDGVGVCVMEPVPTGSAPVWEFGEGATAIANLQRIIDNDDVPNVVVVYGTNPAVPGIRAEAFDANPLSPTYRYGPYGERVREFSEPRISSQDQAQQMANAELIKALGPGETFEFDCVPNLALDAYDTITLTWEPLGLERAFATVARIQAPHRASGGTMHVTARRAVTLPGATPIGSSPIVTIGVELPTPPPPALVDLVPYAITIDPDPATSADAITFQVEVHNDGTADTDGATALQADWYVDGVLVASKAAGAAVIAAGASTIWSADTTWQASQGTHIVDVYLDPDQLLTESTTENNHLQTSIEIGAPIVVAPDLIVTAVTSDPVDPIEGDDVTFSATVKNQGTDDYSGTPTMRVDFLVDGVLVAFVSAFASPINMGASVTVDADGRP